jgi:hypothetical protein
VLIMKETLWKNNLNFVKDTSMIYVNFIIIVITASEKGNRRHYFRTTPHTCLKLMAGTVQAQLMKMTEAKQSKSMHISFLIP